MKIIRRIFGFTTRVTHKRIMGHIKSADSEKSCGKERPQRSYILESDLLLSPVIKYMKLWDGLYTDYNYDIDIIESDTYSIHQSFLLHL